MAKKEQKFVGVEIERKSLKILEINRIPPLRNIPQRFQILRFKYVERTEITPEVIKEVIGGMKLSGLESRICIGGPQTIIRFVDMPKMSVQEFKSALKFEVDKYVPFPVEEIYFDGDVLKEEENNIKTIIVGVKKSYLDPFLKVFEDINLYPQVVSLGDICLVNLFLYFYFSQYKDKNIGLFNVGKSISSINVIIKGVPLLTRAINTGIDRLLKELSLKGSAYDEKVKSVLEDTELNKKAPEFFNFLFREIRLTLDYFEVHSGQPLEQLFITGNICAVKNFPLIVEENLGIKSVFLNVSNYLDFSQEISKEEFEAKEFLFHSCLGLFVK